MFNFNFIKFFFLAFVFITSEFCYAQGFYHNLGKGLSNESGTAIAVGNDGSIYLGGEEGNNCFISKLDSSGTTVLWTQVFTLDSQNINQLNHLSITSDNYLIGTADIICPNQKFCGTGYFKFDLNGNSIWIKKLEAPTNHFSSRKLLQLDTSTYILVGMQYVQTGPSFSDWKFFKLNAKSGAIKYQSDLIDETHDGLSNYLDDIFSTTSIKNNSFYFTGRIYAAGPDVSSMRPNIVKMDTNFNVIWSNFYFKSSGDNARIYPYDIEEYDDTLICAYTGDKNWIGPNFTCGLIKLKSNGDVLWQKDYDVPNSAHDHTASIQITPDGYMIYGATNLLTTGNHDFFFIKTDRNGTVLWSKLIGGNTSNEGIKNEAYGSSAFKNNSLYFVGESDASFGKIALGKITNNGAIACVTQSPIAVSTTVIPNYQMPNTNRILYPDTVTLDSVSNTSMNFTSNCGSFSLGKDSTFCASGNFLLSAPFYANASYRWNTGDTSATILVQDSGNYAVHVIANCCSYFDTIHLSKSDSKRSTQILILCAGDSLKVGNHYYATNGVYTDTLYTQFGCDSVVHTNLNFYPTHYSFSTVACAGDSILFHGIYIKTPGTYHDTLVSFLGCDSIISFTLSFQNNPFPNFSLGNDTSFCFPFSYLLTAPYFANTQYQWNTGDTAWSILVQDTGNYFVSLSNPCFQEIDTIHISKKSTSTFSQTLHICEGDSVKVGSHFYSLSGSYTDTLASLSHCDSVLFTTLLVSPTHFFFTQTICEGDSLLFNENYITSSGSYTANLHSAAGCDSIVQLNATFLPSPQLEVFGDTLLCKGQSAQLIASGALTYLWKPATGLNVTNQALVLTNTTINQTYKIVGAIGTCIDSTQVNIKVFENPSNRFSYYLEACELKVNFKANNSNSNICLWDFGDGTLSNLCAPSHRYSSEGNYTIQLHQENSAGCKSDTSFSLMVSELYSTSQLKIPNFFTPNNDGFNDVFYFGNYPDCLFISYEIFNVLGQKIYESEQVTKGWDGTNNNGYTCVIGTYFYRLKGERKSYSGVVELIR